MSDANIDDLPQIALEKQRKPRIALMGEFSAGKSTLMNLLLGCDPLPVRITATRVPPVWVTYGTEAAVRVLEDGREEELAMDALTDVPLDGTQWIRLFLDSDILNLCDLIDIPGISDPNMKHEDWLGLIGEVDCVIWCTHATQAWRQSEAALWEQVSTAATKPNFLVVTQFDKLRTERDRTRVLARLDAETEGAFEAILPISTLDAINAGVDETAWVQSGGAALIEQLVTILVADSAPLRQPEEYPEETKTVNAVQNDKVGSSQPKPLHLVSDETKAPTAKDIANAAASEKNRVTPRRVRPKSTNLDRQAATNSQPTPLHANAIEGES